MKQSTTATIGFNVPIKIMNTTFKTWTRSTAFNLSMNSEAIEELLFLEHFTNDVTAHGKNHEEYSSGYEYNRSLCGYLHRRGMIREAGNGFVVTEEGMLVARLLRSAGFGPSKQYGSAFAPQLYAPAKSLEACVAALKQIRSYASPEAESVHKLINETLAEVDKLK